MRACVRVHVCVALAARWGIATIDQWRAASGRAESELSGARCQSGLEIVPRVRVCVYI